MVRGVWYYSYILFFKSLYMNLSSNNDDYHLIWKWASWLHFLYMCLFSKDFYDWQDIEVKGHTSPTQVHSSPLNSIISRNTKSVTGSCDPLVKHFSWIKATSNHELWSMRCRTLTVISYWVDVEARWEVHCTAHMDRAKKVRGIW